MKRKLIAWGFALLPLIVPAQCVGDTIPSTPGWVEHDTLMYGGMVPCLQYCCESEACHLWEIQSNFNGAITIASDGTILSESSIQFWNACDSILLDTCFVIQETTLASPIYASFQGRVLLQICGLDGTPVVIHAKGTASPVYRRIDTPVIAMDTLCPVWTKPPAGPAKQCYWNPITGEVTRIPEPNSYYKKVSCERR